VGLLDYYRQFEGLSEEEVNRDKRAVADERKRKALERVEPLDLSQSTWPALPHPYVVNAVTYAARRGLHRYPITRSGELTSELAHRHDLDPRRVVVGNGAAQLLSAAAHVLIEPGQELVTPWPSYPLYPIMARRARGIAVPVAGAGIEPILSAVNERTRVVALANPNDPTGALMGVGELRQLLESLPEQVAVLLDEALVEFAGPEAEASLDLLEDHSRLLIFRSFSKAWGLAGLRVGYALCGPGAEELLAELEPDLGINELAQAGVLESLRSGPSLLAKRVRAVEVERGQLTESLRDRGFDVPDSRANFLWVAHPELEATELADGLERAAVIVAAGAALGEPGHVRMSVRDRSASERVLRTLDALLPG
jgi:histidinol-phosphate aminotransferase